MKAAKKIPPPEVPWENPLIPNKRLRQLYTSMAELRQLDNHIAAIQRRAKSSTRLQTTLGQEACRVATVCSLMPGDLTVDCSSNIATNFLSGAKLADIIHSAYLSASSGRPAKPLAPSPTQLPATADPIDSLYLALGAALALHADRKGKLVLAYLDPSRLTLPLFKPLLRLAADHAAPMLFVVFPSTAVSPNSGSLNHASTACGVPGIPVDAADAVALYRVAQESVHRIRSGGGPVLMECIPFRLPGQKTPAQDPVANMREALIRRNLADASWFDKVEGRFAARLKAADL